MRAGIREQGSGIRDRALKWLLKGFDYIDEKVAQVVSKASERLDLWLRVVETRTLRAAFLRCFGCREFN
jgi:hypothetical protein